MKRWEIRELLEACHADLRDLTEEEARALVSALEQDSTLQDEWRAMQSWDAEIRQAFRDVPVPSGLSERLSAALAAQGPLAGDAPVANALAEPQVVPTAPATHRLWLFSPTQWAIGILATSALLLLATMAVVWGLRSADRLTAEQVAEASRAWVLDPEAWQSVTLPPADYPWGSSVRLRIVAWQRCAALTDSHAVAYLAEVPPDRSTAWLVVIQTRQGRLLPTFPPTFPDSTTGNVCVGVWKTNGCVYVLIVPGRQSNYLRALQQSFA